jgi:hypothetical protein
MAFLKQNMPAIYQYFQSYTPNNAQLAIDDNGFINIVANNAFVYQADPKVMSLKQVEVFLQNPPSLDFEVEPVDIEKCVYQHEKVISGIFHKRKTELKGHAPYVLKPGGQINFIAFIGSGLGYHIEQLLDQYSIRSLFVFEPEPDVFFATLHTADIGAWFDACQRLGGELTFKIGGTEEEFVNEVYSSFRREGFFNLVQMYFYRHYMSDKTTDAFRRINELAYRYKAGWGFCEDEIIGISHTLTNISKNKAHILLNEVKNHQAHPIFVIGNGPSLNDNLEYIKENQNNAIIISSGTSLKPLLDNGIVPDLHVEQERPKYIYQWVKKIGHEALLKQIPLLCLNTVYPGILSLFKQPYVVMKSGDAGTTFINEYVSDKYKELFFCNPTVTNASTSAAIAMGFKKLYLFGLDYGFKSKEEHHAKGSAYDDVKTFQLQNELKVADNNGGQINTTRTFDFSRGVLEMLLSLNKQVDCINVSDGAKIEHAKYAVHHQLPKMKEIKNKKEVVERYLKNSFNDDYVISHDLSAEFKAVLPEFQAYIAAICDSLNDVVNKNQLTEIFSLQYKFVNDFEGDRSRKLFHKIFSGSLNYLQASIMDNVSRYREQVAQEDYIAFCINEMKQHLIFLINDLSDHFDKDARA